MDGSLSLDFNFLQMKKLRIHSDEKSSDYAKEMNELQTNLNNTRELFNNLYINEQTAKIISKVMKIFDPFNTFKYDTNKIHKGQIVNNSWLKLWEILSTFKLISHISKDETFITLDVSNKPGASISALNHYVKTMTGIKSHIWIGMCSDKENNELYSKYESRWLESDLKLNDIDEVVNKCSKISDKVCLAIFDYSLELLDYNKQEINYIPYLMGQLYILSQTLNLGGNSVIKIYTLFEKETQSILIMLSKVFKEVFLYHPYASKGTNSETHIVCINFQGIDLAMVENIKKRAINEEPSSYMRCFHEYCKNIYVGQISSLSQSLEIYKKMQSNEELLKTLKIDAKNITKSYVQAWASMFPVKTLKCKDKLRIKD